MKRIFYILFIFYFLSLVLSPCECSHHTTNTAQESNNHKNKSESDKMCHPFCGCTYYASCITTNNLELPTSKLNINKIDEAIHLDSKIKLVIFPIWQPPQQLS